MEKSLLMQVLERFMQAESSCSIGLIADELGISQAQLHSMLQYWVRKGRIKESDAAPDCKTCGSKSVCPFLMKSPVTFEFVE